MRAVETDNLPAGSHQVVAIYQGGAGYQSSLSKPEQVQANVSTVAGFTVAATPTTLSTAVGGFVSSVVTVTPVNGFNAYVSLSCTGLPYNTTCNFTPVNVPAKCTTSGSGRPDLHSRNQRDADPNTCAFAGTHSRQRW